MKSTIPVQLPNLGSCLLFLVAVHAMISMSLAASLKVGYYRYKCPSAEAMVRKVVRSAVVKNPGMAPGLIRMHFHDCFIRGCDASILLDSTPGNAAEKDSPVNNPSLRGFEVIDKAKAAIESLCPSTVSCADILAFAARDAAYLAGGINYHVKAGRRDGRVSLESEVFLNLPPPFFNTEQLIANFARKGLSVDDMVTLSGAHSFGVSHCSSFSNRLYSFNATHPQDPTMDWAFAAYLKYRCPTPTTNGGDPTVNQDVVTPNKLDNQFYNNLKKHKGLFTSDQTLQDSFSTAKLVAVNAESPRIWSAKFAAAMVRMGTIDVLKGSKGEIRKNCRVVNYY